MKKRSLGDLSAALLLAFVFCNPFLARDDKEDKQEQAAALLRHAAEITDLKARGSPPFHLRAKVQLLEMAHGKLEGTYALIWSSPSQWREEIIFPGFSQVRVAGEGKFWQQRSTDHLPIRIHQLQETLNLTSALRLGPDEKADKIRRTKCENTKQVCVTFTKNARRSRELCFSEEEGTLTRVEEHRPAYRFSEYLEWEGKRFPQLLETQDGKRTVVRVNVAELTSVMPEDASLFTPPPDSVVWETCEDPQEAAVLTKRPPRYPRAARMRRIQGIVSVYVIIGSDGLLHNMKVLASPDPSLSEATLEGLRSWRYRPAACASGPIPVETLIDVAYLIR